MAKSKDQLLAKIDSLILEVNSQYTDLRGASRLEGIDIALLASNMEYLANQVKALHYFEEPKTARVQPVDNVAFFTPSSSLDKEVDEQETYSEIEEEPVEIVQETPKVEIFSAYVEEEEVVKVEETKPSVEEVISTIIETSVVSEPEVLAAPAVVEEVKGFVKEIEVLEEVIAAVEEVPSRPLTINELIQQQKQAGVNLTQQFQTSTAQDKVVDLKSAISLNDKLLFIKDLFNGYSLAYSEALELLNRFNSYAEADAFLQSNYALKNGWAEKPQSVEKFYGLLRKKFNV